MKKLGIAILLALGLFVVGCKKEPLEKMCVNCGQYLSIDKLEFDGLNYYCNCYGKNDGYCNDCGKIIPINKGFYIYKDVYCENCYEKN